MSLIGDLFGPPDVGVTRTIEVKSGNFIDSHVLEKRLVTIVPIPETYTFDLLSGEEVEEVGYLEMRTFVTDTEAGLKQAFEVFATAGIRKLVVDLRYNGGGLIRVAESTRSPRRNRWTGGL